MRRLRTGSAALGMVVALVATACSGSEPAGIGRTGPEGVLRLGIERPHSLDPAEARFPAEVLLADQLFDGLTAYDPDTLAVRPAVAERWEASPDLKVWTFRLRPDARFQNGAPITSTDVRFSLQRVARMGSESPAAAALEVVAGFEEYGTDQSRPEVAGIATPDPATVRFTLHQPFAGFPAVLGHPALGIVPRAAAEGRAQSFRDQPVGSGPFMIRSRSADILRLIPAPGVKAGVKEVEVHLGRDTVTTFTDFLRGRLDWAAVPAERVAEVRRVRGEGSSRPYPAQLLYGLNLRNPKFADPRFREAIMRALDRRAIVEGAFGDRVRVLSGLVPEGFPGHQPDACGDACRFDPARARALVAAAFGNKPVPEVAIDFDDDPVQQSIANAIAAHLQAVGIPSVLRPHRFTDYLGFAASGRQELFRFGWIGAHPTQDAFLAPLYLSGREDNVTGFSAPEVDALLARARAEADDQVRIETYREAERQILARYPVIPLAQYETHTLVAARVKGLNLTAFGTFDASRVRLTG